MSNTQTEATPMWARMGIPHKAAKSSRPSLDFSWDRAYLRYRGGVGLPWLGVFFSTAASGAATSSSRLEVV